MIVGARIDALAVDEELAHRRIAGAGHFDPPLVQHQNTDGHLVPGQCPGLIGTDDGSGAERFDGGEPAHQRPHPGHALHPQCQRHGRDGGQPLGYGGNGKRQADLKHVPEIGETA